jgi:hypothetical protein
MRFHLGSKRRGKKFYFSYATFLSLLRHQFNVPEEFALNSSHVWLKDTLMFTRRKFEMVEIINELEIVLVILVFGRA